MIGWSRGSLDRFRPWLRSPIDSSLLSWLWSRWSVRGEYSGWWWWVVWVAGWCRAVWAMGASLAIVVVSSRDGGSTSIGLAVDSPAPIVGGFSRVSAPACDALVPSPFARLVDELAAAAAAAAAPLVPVAVVPAVSALCAVSVGASVGCAPVQFLSGRTAHVWGHRLR